MNCRDTARFLNPYVDGELDLTSALAIEEHLDKCTRCRAEERELRLLRETVRQLTDFRSVPESLRAILRKRHGEKSAWRHLFLPRRRRFAVATFALLLFVCVLGLIGLREMPKAEPLPRVVYHIASHNVDAALRNLANHLDASRRVKIVVVAHNDGVDFLLRGAHDEDGRPYEATVRKFSERGVEFRVCGNTLVRRSIASNSVIPVAVLVPSGIAEISRLQSEEGYVYMKL